MIVSDVNAHALFMFTVPAAHLVERAAVLGGDVELLAERRERTAVHAVRVRGAVGVRARGVDGGVDHEGGLVQEPVWTRVGGLDIAVVVNEDEVARLDQGEVLSLGDSPALSRRVHRWIHVHLQTG